MTKPTQPDPPDIPSAEQAAPTPGQPVRSEGLLPADEPNASLDVAEEVSLDQQSDSARRIGALSDDTPATKPADALAVTLRAPPSPAGKQ